MRHKALPLAVLVFFLCLSRQPVVAKGWEGPDSIFSLDMSFLTMGLTHGGLGLGFSYEKSLPSHFAVKTAFGHSLLKMEEKWAPSVTFGLAGEYYPFSENLNKLYLSLGSYVDFIGYTDADAIVDSERLFISMLPSIGWKWNILRCVTIDLHGGYKYVFANADTIVYKEYEDYLRRGIQASMSIKINLKYLFRRTNKKQKSNSKK